MQEDIKKLGGFWGTIHTLIKTHPKITITEVLEEGQFWECGVDGCHQPFQSCKAIRQHFTYAHASSTTEG
jgi:hypothetical protein